MILYVDVGDVLMLNVDVYLNVFLNVLGGLCRCSWGSGG